MKRAGMAALVFVQGFALTGCGSTEYLVYVQEASLGFTVALGAEGMEKISLGYDRDVMAIVPSMEVGSGREAMSMLSINRSSISGLADMQMTEFVAAGTPATQLASLDEAVRRLRQKIHGGGN